MRILHTADWHIGKRLLVYNRLDEQKAVLNEIIDIADAEDVDMVLVAGDLFDAINPSAEAEDCLYNAFKRLADGGRRPVVAIAGNHDDPVRIEAQDHFGRECGILLAGFPKTEIRSHQLNCEVRLLASAPGFVELKLCRHDAPVRLISTPYANENRMRAFFGMENAEAELRDNLQQHWQALANLYMDDRGVNLLTAHLFMMKRGGEKPEESDDERSILQVGGASIIYTDQIPAQVQYVALGHLHRYQELGGGPCPVVYSSSPLAYSYAESNQQKYAVIVEAEPGQPVQVRSIPLQTGKRLLKPRFKSVPEAVDWLVQNPECYPEIILQTPTYLTSDERRQLQQAHPNLVAIVPDIREADNVPDQPETTRIDPTESIETLFAGYFKHEHNGQEPNERLTGLFREILTTDPT